MAQDPVDHARISNQGDDAHAGAAGSASQRVGLENLPDQTSPRAPGLPAQIGIVLVLGRWGGLVAVPLRMGRRDPASVGIRAVESLTVASRVGNMRGDPVDPFQGVEHHAGGAGARVRGRLQRQRAVIEFLERIHGQGRARDVAALEFERGEGGGIDRRSGEN